MQQTSISQLKINIERHVKKYSLLHKIRPVIKFCRGVYLACVCYNDDKILVTTEDNIPIVEVDESYSGNSLQADFDWLMKVVASAWDTARQLKQDLEKLSELSSMHLKNQLLSAVLQLQVRLLRI